MQAQPGNTVRVHYTGRLTDGSTFDSSEQRDPLEFTLGNGELIPGFEQAILRMAPGQSKTETIPAAQAYGPHRPELLMEVDRQSMPPDLQPYIGQQLQMTRPNGTVVQVVVSAVHVSHVTLDANHPLAGKELIFDLTLVEIL